MRSGYFAAQRISRMIVDENHRERLSGPAVDLADDVRRDSTFPRSSRGYANIHDHLSSKGASGPALDAFKEAWEGYAATYSLPLPARFDDDEGGY